MKIRRTRLDIILQLLELIEKQGEARITPLMYQVNISYNALISYLDFLHKQKLVELVNKNPRIYKITNNGREVLKHFQRLKEALGVSSIASIKMKMRKR